ncbi:MAG: hypothetical protein PWQ42_997 [Sulfurospirillum sp.]|jgi:hypothetical protein|nr:hypothetical protein [Sulfurospirillum sp.]
MQNALFDDLKNLKTKMQEDEKKDNQKKEEALRAQKEEKIKTDFESFMKASGIKKI